MIPPGYLLMEPLDALMVTFAPTYLRLMEDGSATLGFRVGAHHCNPRGSCHGGTWATLADIVMGINVGLMTGLGGPTVSMTIDYLGAATTDQWVEGSVRLLRQTRNLAFIDCVFTADGELALRASSIVRRKWQPYKDFSGLLAAGAQDPEIA